MVSQLLVVVPVVLTWPESEKGAISIHRKNKGSEFYCRNIYHSGD